MSVTEGIASCFTFFIPTKDTMVFISRRQPIVLYTDNQERADGIIDEFVHNADTPTVFPGIPKPDFLHSLRNNIRNPRSINQCNNGCWFVVDRSGLYTI